VIYSSTVRTLAAQLIAVFVPMILLGCGSKPDSGNVPASAEGGKVNGTGGSSSIANGGSSSTGGTANAAGTSGAASGGTANAVGGSGAAGASTVVATCSTASFSCGTHGTCDDSGAAVVCKCVSGYAGRDCSECAAGHHNNGPGICVLDQQCMPNSCGGHGACTVAAGVVSCACDAGSSGTYCDSCSLGYHRTITGTCEVNQACSDNSCTSHGTCADATGTPVCACAAGYAATSCNQCAAGFHLDTAQVCVLDQQCMPNSCSGHGACGASNGLVGCTCDTGYTGAYCSSCSTGHRLTSTGTCDANQACAADSCGAHGTCHDSTGTVVCTCAGGYSGTTCNQCASGYHAEAGNTCVLDQQCMSTSCSNHGTCSVTGGMVSCVCASGYRGTFCDACTASYHATSAGNCEQNQACPGAPCSGHGTCNDSSGLAVCACESGYSGADCSQCAAGHHSASNGTCALDVQCLPSVCSYHGSCNDSTKVAVCTCNAGYSGAYCDACSSGYHRGADGTCVASEVCQTGSCGTHGTCNDSTGVTVCQCVQGYAGATCGQCSAGYHLANGACVVDETCLSTTCAGQGTCTLQGGLVSCTCSTGYAGANCNQCYPGYAINSITGMCEVPCQMASEIRCGGQCVSGTTAAHCGSCGQACAGDAQCQPSHGKYDCTCPYNLCGTSCVALQTNPQHCGTCSKACDAGQKCVFGQCQSESGSCGTAGCPADYLCCDGNCVYDANLKTDDKNCGGCKIACDTGNGQHCVNAHCQVTSNSCGNSNPQFGQICCGANTVMINYDNSNCGGCGIVCASGETCNQGECQCASGTERCSDGCKDTRFDSTNCGGCGLVCNGAAGERCVYGVCTTGLSACGAMCSSSQLCCSNYNNSPTTAPVECVTATDFATSTEHCGGCGKCAQGEQCTDGQCLCSYPNAYCPDPSNLGQNLCITIHVGGMGSSQDSANKNCGACGKACTGGQQCQTGDTCACPSDKSNFCAGSCVDSGHDEQNCGTCGNVCATGEACVGGKCLTQNGTGCTGCQESELCCAVNSVSKCTNVASDNQNCGGCGAGFACGAGYQCSGASCQPTGDLCSAPLHSSNGTLNWNASSMSGALFTNNGAYTTSCATPDGANPEGFYVFEPSNPGKFQINLMATSNVMIAFGAGSDPCTATLTNCLTSAMSNVSVTLSGPTTFMVYATDTNYTYFYLNGYASMM